MTRAVFGRRSGYGGADALNVQDVTAEFSFSDARFKVNGAFLSGNIIQLCFTVSLTAALAAGGSITGTMSTPYIPATTVTSVTMNAGRPLGLFLRGNVQQAGTANDPLTYIVRNLGSSATGATSSFTFGLTYIFDEVEQTVEGEAI